MRKSIFIGLLVIILGGFAVVSTCTAATSTGSTSGAIKAVSGGFGVGTDTTPRNPLDIAANIIRIFIGILGFVAVCMIVLAGYKWMTSGGDSGVIEEAKDMLKNAAIGLIIIMVSYGIAEFVLRVVIEPGTITNPTVTNPGNNPGGTLLNCDNNSPYPSNWCSTKTNPTNVQNQPLK